MIEALVSGKLHGQPAQKISKTGKPFVVAKVRAHAGEADVFVNVIAFSPAACEALLALGEGERQGRALYFTRSTLYGDAPIWRHIGVYGYRREALNRFCAAPQSPLERREKLEQLRALEMGIQIWAAVIDEAPLSVDNPADLEAARALV